MFTTTHGLKPVSSPHWTVGNELQVCGSPLEQRKVCRSRVVSKHALWRSWRSHFKERGRWPREHRNTRGFERDREPLNGETQSHSSSTAANTSFPDRRAATLVASPPAQFSFNCRLIYVCVIFSPFSTSLSWPGFGGDRALLPTSVCERMLPALREDALSGHPALVHLGWWGSLGLQRSGPQPGAPQSSPVGLTVGKRLAYC